MTKISIWVVVLLFSAQAALAQNINVTFKNSTSFDYTFEVEDMVCGNQFQVTLNSGGSDSRPICSSGALDDGYGKVKFRKQGNSSWTEKSLLRAGDSVSLN